MRHFNSAQALCAILIFLACSTAHSQAVATFENLDLSVGDYLNGSNGVNNFMSGDIELRNEYNEDYDAWQGWAISATTDTVTPGYINQYSAIAGGGASGSQTYALTYAYDGAKVFLAENSARIFDGMYVTNSTLTYLSMLDGDAFAKKFGGATGNDPDYFLLTIKAYLNGSIGTDSIDFYLADFRSPDNSKDYIIRDWTWVGLEELGNADSLLMMLRSSDNGIFGMNTPAYFCVDDISTQNTSHLSMPSPLPFPGKVYPNPASDHIMVEYNNSTESKLELFDQSGICIFSEDNPLHLTEIDISSLAPGQYTLRVCERDRCYSTSLIVID